MSENSTLTTANETIIVSKNFIHLNINMSNIRKLIGVNFFIWSRQFHF